MDGISKTIFLSKFVIIVLSYKNNNSSKLELTLQMVGCKVLCWLTGCKWLSFCVN